MTIDERGCQYCGNYNPLWFRMDDTIICDECSEKEETFAMNIKLNITLTKELIKKQAKLLQAISERPDINTGEGIYISLSSCYNLIAETYGFESWNELSALLKEDDKK